MKYHSSIPAIVIACVVVLLFGAVAVFAVAGLSSLSPTERIASEILKALDEQESPVSVSFSSMDRNFRDGIEMMDVKVDGSGFCLSFSRLTLRMGILSLLKYAVTGSGQLVLDTTDTKIYIDPFSLPSGNKEEKTESSGSLTLPKVFSRYNIALHAHDLDLTVEGIATVSDGEIDIAVSDTLTASGRTSGLTASYNGIELEMEDIAFDFLGELRILTGKTAVSYQGNKAELEALRADVGLDKSVALNAYGLEAVYEGNRAALSSLSASLEGEEISVEVKDLETGYAGYDLKISNALAYLSGKDIFTVLVYGGKADKEGVTVISAPSLRLTGSIAEKTITLSSPELDTGYSQLYTDVLTNAALKRLRLDASLEDKLLDFSFRGSLALDSGREAIDGTGAKIDISGSLDLTDGIAVNTISVDVADGQIPALSTPFDLDAYYDGSNADLYFSLGSSMVLSGVLTEDGISFSSYLNDVRLGELSSIVEIFLPQFANWVDLSTSASGSIGLEIRRGKNGFEGPVNLALAVSDIKFNDFHFSLGAGISAELGQDELAVSNASLTSSFARASWSGGIDLRSKLPYGSLVVTRTESGIELLRTDLTLSESREYSFSTWLPMFPDGWFRGTVDFSQERVIDSQAELRIAYTTYPVALRLDFVNQLVTLDSDAIDFDLDFGGRSVDGTLLIDAFALPAMPDVEPCMLYLDLTSSFDFYSQEFILDIPYARAENMRHVPMAPDLSFRAEADNQHLRLDDIVYSGKGIRTLEGALDFSFSEGIYTIYLSSDGSAPEEVLFSLSKENNYYTGLFRFVDFDFSRFGFYGYRGGLNLTGSGSHLSDIAFIGLLSIKHQDGLRSLDAGVYFDLQTIRLTGGDYTGTTVSLSLPLVELDAAKGTFRIDTSASYVRENKDRDYPMSASLSLQVDTGARGNIADLAIHFRDTGPEAYKIKLYLDSINVDNRYFVQPSEISVAVSGQRLLFEGGFLNGYYDIGTGALNVAADLLPLAKANVDGYLGGGQNTALHMAVDAADVSIINIFLPKPFVHLYEGTMAHGDLNLVSDGEEWDFYGHAEVDTAEMDVFWLPGSKVVLHNPAFIAWDNQITANVTDATVVNLTTYEKYPGKASMAFQLTPNLRTGYFEVNIEVAEGYEVPFRLPVIKSNLDMWGKISGELGFHYEGSTYSLTGDVRIKDGRLSYGMESLPDWWVPSNKRSEMDLKVLLIENVSIVIPLGPDPILTAYAAENQKLRVQLKDSKLDLSGSIGIRSGEFYYINKNFYITEGSVEFQSTAYSSLMINPMINLRARLRDFDQNGNKVDIYVVLRDATLEYMTPYFESSPAKSSEEILQLLGLAMLPSSMYGEFSLSSLLSLFSTGYDVLSHAGILSLNSGKNVSFEDAVKDALYLDTFSLHTSLVTNVLLDTVSTALTPAQENLSPMARYLDGTSIYFGKYLSPALYFEGLIHLTSIENQFEQRHTFIADDLNLDIEVSLEWAMPIATVKFFTQPENITPYSLMDTFGFTVTKKLTW